MEIGIVGTGFIAGVLGRALATAGHDVTFGSRHPEEGDVAGGSGARVASVPAALTAGDVVVLALPGAAVADLAAAHGELLAGALVVDATNRMGAPVANARASLPDTVRYARAFNTLGGEVMARPVFEGRPADMFFSAPEADRPTVEALVAGVGLRPVYVGPDQEELLDCLFRLWVTLAVSQGRGRRLALRLLDGDTDR
ncbi:MAG: NAD(P)-binding domain-containing protein [Acidobacteriota bacterium]|nr:NAD(P)-binding domain-containing protein [Acidobacteriota bacterium]